MAMIEAMPNAGNVLGVLQLSQASNHNASRPKLACPLAADLAMLLAMLGLPRNKASILSVTITERSWQHWPADKVISMVLESTSRAKAKAFGTLKYWGSFLETPSFEYCFCGPCGSPSDAQQKYLTKAPAQLCLGAQFVQSYWNIGKALGVLDSCLQLAVADRVITRAILNEHNMYVFSGSLIEIPWVQRRWKRVDDQW